MKHGYGSSASIVMAMLMAKHHLCTLLFFVVIATSSFCSLGTSDVLELTDLTFDAAIAKHDYIFVDFYAPWCGHCKRLSPELDLAAPGLAEKTPPIVLAKINADKYTKIASKYGVSAYPTLKFFIKGFPLDYKGPRQASPLSSHLEKLTHPDIEVLRTEVELEDFMHNRDSNLPIFIGFGIQSSIISDLARQYKNQAWFVVLEKFSEKAMENYDFDKGPAIVVRSVHGEQEVYYGPFTGEDLVQFVGQNLLPRVNEVTPEDLRKLRDDGRPIALGILKEEISTHSLLFIKMLKAAAPANRAFVFAYVDTLKWPSFCRTFHIDKHSNLPEFIIWDGSSTYFESAEGYDFSDERAASYITFFLQEFKEGKAKKVNVKGPTLTEFIQSLISVRSVYLLLSIIAMIIFARSIWTSVGTDVVGKRIVYDNDTTIERDPPTFTSNDNSSVKED